MGDRPMCLFTLQNLGNSLSLSIYVKQLRFPYVGREGLHTSLKPEEALIYSMIVVWSGYLSLVLYRLWKVYVKG